MVDKRVTRRQFLKSSASAAVATAIGSLAMGQQAVGDRIRCGFIGVGGRGTVLLHETLNFKDVTVVAICDIDEANLNRAIGTVEKARDTKPVGYSAGPCDYRRLLDRKDIDAVVIATPCYWHAPMYLDTISAGKHLYGEKPMCLTVKEANEIVKAARKSPKLTITIGFQWCANPIFMESVKLIRQGEIGELIEGRMVRSNTGALRGWFSKRAQSGDWCIEQACHDWNIFNLVMGTTPLRAYAVARKDLYTPEEPERDVADYYTAIIEYPKGFSLSAVHTWMVPSHGAFSDSYCRVIGRQGACDVGSGQFAYSDGREERRVGMGVNDTQALLRNFFDCTRTGEKPLAGVENGRDSLFVGLLIRMAYDERRIVTWDEMLKAP